MDKIRTMCWKCGKDLPQTDRISRNDTCTFCGADLHCCRNCRFYEPGSHYDCHESVEDPVLDKERANFCDFFKLKEGPVFGAGSESAAKKEKAKADFDALFSI